jgi:hypothetical protein
VRLALTGATLGTLLDAIHTQSGATAYTHPVVASTAWWVPLLFAGAYSIGLIRPLLDAGPAPPTSRAVLALSLFVVAYGCSALPLAWPLTSGLLLALFAATYVLCDRTRVGLVVAILAAVLGPAFEGVLVHAGVFVHTRPVIAGVSGWLPFLYLTAAIALQALGKRWVDGSEVALSGVITESPYKGR